MNLPNADVLIAAEGSPPVQDLDALYRAHAPIVARWVAKLAGPSVDVEDLVHEIFLVAWQKLAKFRGDAKV